MSGPKGFDVALAERARVAREAAAARARCEALHLTWEASAHAMAALGGTSRRPRRRDLSALDLRELETLEQSLRTEVAHLDDSVRALRISAVRAHLAQVFEEVSASPAQDGPIAASTESPASAGSSHVRDAATPEPTAQRESERLRARLVRTLEVVAEIDEAPRAPLLKTADAISRDLSAGDVGRARLNLTNLQTETERALRQQHELDRVRRQAGDLLVRCAWMAGDEADALRGRALACATTAKFASVLEAEEDLAARLRAAGDRAYIVEQTRAALASLGYEVGAEFAETALRGESAVATRPDLDGYGLQWRFGPQPGQVFTNVVSFSWSPATSAAVATRDAEVERTTCGDIEAVRAAWHENGLGATLRHHREPGQVAVERVTGPAATTAQRRSAARHRRTTGLDARIRDAAGGGSS